MLAHKLEKTPASCSRLRFVADMLRQDAHSHQPEEDEADDVSSSVDATAPPPLSAAARKFVRFAVPPTQIQPEAPAKDADSEDFFLDFTQHKADGSVSNCFPPMCAVVKCCVGTS
jgi:hypothetical protein